MSAAHIIEIERHSNGPRLRLFGQRVHHGAVGALACAAAPLAGKRTRIALTGIGALAMIEDRHDGRVWFAPGPQR